MNNEDTIRNNTMIPRFEPDKKTADEKMTNNKLLINFRTRESVLNRIYNRLNIPKITGSIPKLLSTSKTAVPGLDETLIIYDTSLPWNRLKILHKIFSEIMSAKTIINLNKKSMNMLSFPFVVIYSDIKKKMDMSINVLKTSLNIVR
jgi:hypothetical protein